MAEKKYVSDNAQLIAEWDWEKNKTLNPTNLTVGSNMKVWWIGSCGHHWEAQIKSRNHGRGCPICAGKIVCPGVNDLKTTRPDIAAEWNYQKNDPLTPSEISQGSHTKVWWKCQHGHSWLGILWFGSIPDSLWNLQTSWIRYFRSLSPSLTEDSPERPCTYWLITKVRRRSLT